MKAYVVAFCGLLLASPAIAEPSGSAGAPTAAPSASTPSNAQRDNGAAHDGEPQICRRIESDGSRRIGSRLVCHTAAEWRALQNAG